MKKGFTLMEVMVATVVVAILSSIAIAGYRQAVDLARQRVCETNLLILEAAAREEALERGALPGVLGSLEPEVLYRAYAEIMKDRSWLTKFCYFFVKLNRPKEAYAKIEKLKDLMIAEKMREYGIEPDVFVCPADQTDEGISYGINEKLLNKKWKNVHNNRIIIADCNSRAFKNKNDFAYRHIRRFGFQKVAQVVRKGGRVQRGHRDCSETDDPK